MPKDDVVAEVSGLQVSNNTFSASPPGSLLIAEEAVLPQKGVVQPRRGQDRAYVMPSPTDIPWAMTEFQGATLVNFAPTKTSGSYGLGVGASSTTGFSGGPYNPVDSTDAYAGRMKFAHAGSYLYFCTTTGPKALESTAGTPRAAGLLQPPDPIGLVNLYSGNNWLPYGATVAIRTVLRRETSDGTPMLSPPSGLLTLTNRVLIPVGSLTKAGGVATAALTPSNDVFLQVGQTFALTPGETDFPAGTYTITGVTNGGPTGQTSSFTFAIGAGTAASTVAQDANAGTRGIDIFAPLPVDAVAGDAMREYRSDYTTTSAPGEELKLANEAMIDGTAILNGGVDIVDTTPQSVLIDPLYTNPQTGEGAAQANFQPPIYRDSTVWQSLTWFANTTAQHAINIQMLGIGAPNGIQNGDTLTIKSGATVVDFTFKTSPTGSTDVKISSSGTPGQNIEATTSTLLFVMLSQLPTGVAAYSVGGSLPGKIQLRRTDFASTPIEVKASRPETWVPALDSSTYVESIAERVPNGLSYSKAGEPEAVPLVNFLTVGSKNFPIARIIALQQALLVFKQGDGIYSVTNSYPFQVNQISLANIIAPDCACAFSDATWAYTDQGILKVTDSGGAVVVSRPIETDLNALRDQFPTQTAQYSFAVPYETERRVMFFVPMDTDDADRPVLRAYCYNNATQAWSGPLYREAFSGVVNATLNKLLLGVYDETWSTGRVTLERKGNGVGDYADAQVSNSITAVNVGGNPLVIRLQSGADVEVGDAIVQGADRITKIAARRTDIGTRYFEVYEDMPWAVSSCDIFKGYAFLAQFQPSGSPSSRKTLTRLSMLFKPEWYEALGGRTLVLTDQIQAELEIDSPSAGFGLNPFGPVPFGDPTPMVVDVNPIDPKWTNAAQFFIGLSVREAFCKVKLQGYAARLETADAPGNRGR